MGTESSATDGGWWCLEVEQEEHDPPYDFVSAFLHILDGKFDDLQRLGITRDCIAMWLYYEYDHNQECNLEFSPQQTKRLGEAGLTRCVSCWEKGSWLVFGEKGDG